MNILITGVGFAGRRFLNALLYFKAIGALPIADIALVDCDAKKLSEFKAGFACYTDYKKAMADFRPDAVIVTANEKEHYNIFRALEPFSVRKILSEKPLVETMEQAKNLSYLAERDFSMNMTERFSPVIARFFEWAVKNPDFALRRAEFFWGKNRIRDPRPTVGVMSEIIHPLDLIKYIFKVGGFHFEAALTTSSDFSVSRTAVVDSCDVLMDAGSCKIVGHSSFVWAHRQREITGLLSDGSRLVRANFVFDNPHWDCDQFRLDSIGPEGQIENILSFSTTNEDFPPELRQIYKVGQFIKCSLFPDLAPDAAGALVGYDTAVELQGFLQTLQEKNSSDLKFFNV